MSPEGLSTVHILIVDGKPGNARLLRGLLTALGIAKTMIAENTDHALDLMTVHTFQAVFFDEAVGPLPLARFAQAIRRNPKLRNPRVPIVLLSDGLQRADVEAARDAGVNDLLVRPLSLSQVKRKLLGLFSVSKPFVESATFLGPDRRKERNGQGDVAQACSLQERQGAPRRRSSDAPAPKSDRP